jgi:predicted Zn finger-like uncharacterized protein
MSSVRLRRLQADYQQVQDYVYRHPRVKLIQSEGEPPERYQLQYQIRSLRQKDDRLLEVNNHMVEISLPRNYPRVPPQCRMLTPIFHPNIAPHAICIGDHWSAGEPLASIVARIGELIAYQSYNTKSPLNGEAARWVVEHVDELPLDPVSMLVEDRESKIEDRGSRIEDCAPFDPRSSILNPQSSIQAEPPAPVIIPEVVPVPTVITCPSCTGQLRVLPEHLGKLVRCPRCKTTFTAPAKDAYA